MLFGEFSDLDESEWDTLTEEAEVPDQERKAWEEWGPDLLTEPSEDLSRHLKNIVEVQFKGTRRAFYENDKSLDVAKGDAIFVEAEKGIDLGIVHLTGKLVHLKRRSKGILYREERKVLRKATVAEKNVLLQLRLREREAYEKCRNRILSHSLPMRLVEAEYQFDGNRVTFYYTADRRVDFRSLVRDLASIFRTRIEMRQIGARDEARKCGGLGICGREFCCSCWLAGRRRVTFQCAAVQNLTSNPARLTGQCGRLKCCLAFEVEEYLEVLKEFPSVRSIIQTKRGGARVEKVDIFGRTVSVQYLDTNEHGKLTIEEVNHGVSKSLIENG